jgi:hypothetical protein
LAVFRCKVLEKTVFDSNTLFVAEVVEADNAAEGRALTYLDYRSYFKNVVWTVLKSISIERKPK